MTSEARTAANRRNATKSTGPRSRAGKARSARNAFRHGLAVALRSLPGADEDIEALARIIVEGDERPGIFEAAREIAEAELDLRRVRRAVVVAAKIREEPTMTAMFETAFQREGHRSGNAAIAAVARIVGRAMVDPEYRDRLTASATRIARAEKLDALDRYERRALSRRKTAIRRFDELRVRLDGL